MAKPVIHKSKNGYVLCRTRKVDNKFIFGTEKDSDVTCKVCLAGGQSNFKRNQFKQYEIDSFEKQQIKKPIKSKSKSMEEIYSISEAFSMQPKTWYVGQSMYYSINPTHRPVISKIKIDDIYDTGDPFSFYVGYSGDGHKLFQIRVQCATVEFIPKPDPNNNQKAQSE